MVIQDISKEELHNLHGSACIVRKSNLGYDGLGM